MQLHISRSAIRELVERHAQMAYVAEHDGRTHAVANDIGDEISDAVNHIASQGGQLAAEHFMRLYREEELALLRDMQASPRQTATRLFETIYRQKTGREPTRMPGAPMLAGPKTHSVGWAILVLVGVGLAFLL